MEQLGLFNVFMPAKKTEIIQKTSIKPVSIPTPVDALKTETVSPTVTMLPNDWRNFLALPVMALASAWTAMTEGKNPCRTCNKSVCYSRNACIVLSSYRAGLEWKFGDSEGSETTAGFAENGGYYV